MGHGRTECIGMRLLFALVSIFGFALNFYSWLDLYVCRRFLFWFSPLIPFIRRFVHLCTSAGTLLPMSIQWAVDLSKWVSSFTWLFNSLERLSMHTPPILYFFHLFCDHCETHSFPFTFDFAQQRNHHVAFCTDWRLQLEPLPVCTKSLESRISGLLSFECGFEIFRWNERENRYRKNCITSQV